MSENDSVAASIGYDAVLDADIDVESYEACLDCEVLPLEIG